MVKDDLSERQICYKHLGLDPAAAVHDRERAIDTFNACHQILEHAQLADRDAGPSLQRLQAAAVNDNLSRHIKDLTHAMEENETLLADTTQGTETAQHLRRISSEAKAVADMLKSASAEAGQFVSSPGLSGS